MEQTISKEVGCVYIRPSFLEPALPAYVNILNTASVTLLLVWDTSSLVQKNFTETGNFKNGHLLLHLFQFFPSISGWEKLKPGLQEWQIYVLRLWCPPRLCSLSGGEVTLFRQSEYQILSSSCVLQPYCQQQFLLMLFCAPPQIPLPHHFAWHHRIPNTQPLKRGSRTDISKYHCSF